MDRNLAFFSGLNSIHLIHPLLLWFLNSNVSLELLQLLFKNYFREYNEKLTKEKQSNQLKWAKRLIKSKNTQKMFYLSSTKGDAFFPMFIQLHLSDLMFFI